MRTWIYASAWLLAFSTGGCSCGQRGTAGDEGDAGGADAARDGALADGQRDGPRGDAPAAPDGSRPWDAGTCEQPWYWERGMRAIYGVSLANGAPPRMGVTEQLLVQVQLLSGSCEALAGVDVSLMPGNATDFVELTAYVWTVAGSVPCTPDAPIVSTVVLFPGRGQGNMRVVVSDGSGPSSEPIFTYDRTWCSGMPDCQCYPGSPAGSGQEYATCLTDCSCAEGFSCIGAIGLVGPGWNCRRPCADDRDCHAYELCAKYVADAAAWVCEPGTQCQGDGDCPEGFACVARADGLRTCADQRAVPTMQECTCDAQCPPGQRCSLIWGDVPSCEVWCQDDADCPLAGQGWLVCGTPEVCLPLE
jgi:hypothetical protein